MLKILGDFIYNVLSKINPTLDFRLDNVITCCKSCNDIKGDKSLEEFKNWHINIYNLHNLGDK